jgi:hypothetical protein
MLLVMSTTALSFAMPDDPDLIARLATRFATDGDPPVSFRRTSAVLTFESQTSETMLRSRVIQALSDVAGPDWQAIVRPVG